jgi:hypothetical protein
MLLEFKVLGDFSGEMAHRVRYRGMKPRVKLAVGAQTARPADASTTRTRWPLCAR